MTNEFRRLSLFFFLLDFLLIGNPVVTALVGVMNLKARQVILTSLPARKINSQALGFESIRKSKRMIISPKVQQLVLKYDSDVTQITTSLLNEKISDLSKTDNDLCQQVIKKMSLKADERIDNTFVHEKLVEIIWDVFALTLPLSNVQPGVDDNVKLESRMHTIAASCLKGGKVLDVGCGHGPLIPYVTNLPPKGPGVKIKNYFGIDLSGEMITAASHLYPKANFFRGNFMSAKEIIFSTIEKKEPQCYDSIIFNGSLQFFVDIKEALMYAGSLLARNEQGEILQGRRIVIAHVNGSKKIDEEVQTNHNTLKKSLPTLPEAKKIAEQLGLEVEVQIENQVANCLADFYLVVLSKV